MSGRIILIDGVSNTGKTTLCDTFDMSNDNVILEEAPNYVRNRPEIYPINGSIPMPQSLEEECDIQAFFLKVEIDRLNEAAAIARSGKNAILDRSFLSIVSIAYSFDKMGVFKGSYKNALELFQTYSEHLKLISEENDFRFVFLEAHYDTVKKRNHTRRNKLSDDWLSREFIGNQSEFFTEQIVDKNAILIDTTNRTREEVFGMVNSKVMRKEK